MAETRTCRARKCDDCVPMISTALPVRRRRSVGLRAWSLPAASAGLEHLPEGGFVLAANHTSNFDPWPLGIPLSRTRQLRFMAKSELFNPVLGPSCAPAARSRCAAARATSRRMRTAADARARGRDRRHVPGGHAPARRACARSTRRGRTPAPRGSRSAPACRSCPRRSPAPTGSRRLGPLRVAYGEPIDVADLDGHGRASRPPRSATERLMSADRGARRRASVKTAARGRRRLARAPRLPRAAEVDPR